ncbi:MAG: pyridoxal-phosphate dependent enzyme [Planctomycetota bacterium]
MIIADRIADLRARAARLPRISLTQLPTPLQECPRFSAAIGGSVRVFMKRDDLILTGFGGNKIRKLEFTMGWVRQQGYDVVVHGLAGQSNYCRQTAAACAVAGIPCHLLLRSDHKAQDPAQGNRLLDYVFGAEVTMLHGRDQAAAKDELVARLTAAGKRPYVIGHDDEVRGAVAYALCLAEIIEQMAALGVTPDCICVTGGAGTSAGLMLGKHMLGFAGEVIGFGPAPAKRDAVRAERIAKIAQDAAALIGSSAIVAAKDIVNTSDFGGPEYGVPTPACLEAIAMLGRTEGLVVGPIYTAKGLAGLISHVRTGRIAAGKNVVFIHTGGSPEIFACNEEVAAYLLASS